MILHLRWSYRHESWLRAYVKYFCQCDIPSSVTNFQVCCNLLFFVIFDCREKITSIHYCLLQVAIQRTAAQQRRKNRQTEEKECLITEQRGGATQKPDALCEHWRKDGTFKKTQRTFLSVNKRKRGAKERRLTAPSRKRPQKSQEGDTHQNHTAYTQHSIFT